MNTPNKQTKRFKWKDLIDILGYFGSSYMKLFFLITFLYVFYSNGGTLQIVKWIGLIFTIFWIIQDFKNSFYNTK